MLTAEKTRRRTKEAQQAQVSDEVLQPMYDSIEEQVCVAAKEGYTSIQNPWSEIRRKVGYPNDSQKAAIKCHMRNRGFRWGKSFASDWGGVEEDIISWAKPRSKHTGWFGRWLKAE